MVKPGGLMVIATINRTAKAFFMAIIGAERPAALAAGRHAPV
jgi:2-polyprenyl-3-methyl-5-hydroxy-6-metoxy-1,4-benzoquinol methylase